MALSCTHYVPKYGSTIVCDQNCGVQKEDRQRDRWTQARTHNKVKTEGPMIL